MNGSFDDIGLVNGLALLDLDPFFLLSDRILRRSAWNSVDMRTGSVLP